MSKCASVVGSQGSHGQRTYEFERREGKKEPSGDKWKLELWHELWFLKRVQARLYEHICM